ncbi:MAG TPA: hypothetical protein VE135_17025 [Pyrinomonadaceae bacterium]|nr:hypothetical protein [Pyrinomonadaceae bacterium]
MIDQNLDKQGQDADDYYQDIVTEDAASIPDGCLGVIVIMFAVGTFAVGQFLF